MLAIVKKVCIHFLRMMSKPNKLSLVKVPCLIVIGFFVGVIVNQSGLVMEVIRLRVELVKTDQNSSPNLTFQQLMRRLPHLNHSTEAPSYLVPNVIHYFWFINDNETMSFIDFLSMFSAYQSQKPDAIWFHCNRLPVVSDYWWGELWKVVPLTVIHHDQQTTKQELMAAQDSAVVGTLLKHGGIFINWNMLVLRSLNPLRNYSTCLGKESDKLFTDIILSGRNALFLQLVHSSMQSDNSASLSRLMSKLSAQQPDLLHLESILAHSLYDDDDASDRFSQYMVRIPANRRQITEQSVRTGRDALSLAMRSIYYSRHKAS